ncbi:MAG TPA: DUF4190 domain-containing protein [Galbitalea sp.]|jgi:hypothetical protein|nr:DUF4190 domain-containing protein [Galbitalea sp.]
MSEDVVPTVAAVPNIEYPAYSRPPAPPERPGRTLGIIGFVLSFFGFIDIAGLIISIVAMAQSKRSGHKNGFALAGIIISAVGILFTAGVIALVVPALINAGQECARLGNGTHVIGNSTYTCTPTSFDVYANS